MCRVPSRDWLVRNCVVDCGVSWKLYVRRRGGRVGGGRRKGQRGRSVEIQKQKVSHIVVYLDVEDRLNKNTCTTNYMPSRLEVLHKSVLRALSL